MNECICIWYSIIIFFQHILWEVFSELSIIYLAREWNINKWCKFPIRIETYECGNIWDGDHSKSWECHIIIEWSSNLNSAFEYFNLCCWCWIILYEKIHPSKKKWYYWHKIKLHHYPIYNEHQYNNNCHNIPWGWMFSMRCKWPGKHIIKLQIQGVIQPESQETTQI